jgi:hypothetical protein
VAILVKALSPKFGEFLTDKRFDEDKLRQIVDDLLVRLDKAKA